MRGQLRGEYRVSQSKWRHVRFLNISKVEIHHGYETDLGGVVNGSHDVGREKALASDEEGGNVPLGIP